MCPHDDELARGPWKCADDVGRIFSPHDLLNHLIRTAACLIEHLLEFSLPFGVFKMKPLQASGHSLARHGLEQNSYVLSPEKRGYQAAEGAQQVPC